MRRVSGRRRPPRAAPERGRRPGKPPRRAGPPPASTRMAPAAPSPAVERTAWVVSTVGLVLMLAWVVAVDVRPVTNNDFWFHLRVRLGIPGDPAIPQDEAHPRLGRRRPLAQRRLWVRARGGGALPGGPPAPRAWGLPRRGARAATAALGFAPGDPPFPGDRPAGPQVEPEVVVGDRADVDRDDPGK